MVPDIDGRQRLQVETDADGKKSIDSDAIAARWNGIRQEFVDYYRPADSADDDGAGGPRTVGAAGRADLQRVLREARRVPARRTSTTSPPISARSIGSRTTRSGTSRPPFQKQRRWDRMMELRGEADKWIKDIEAQEKAFKNSLYSLLDRAAEGAGPGAGQLESVPLGPDGADQLRRDLWADGHRAVPDAGLLHAAGGLGRGGASCASS